MESTRLLKWYRRARRDLPWRKTSDPYAIWVSEIMLQQTRVAAAIPYYERFLERFPDVATLARARESSVLARWSGLGYYRRARMLHQAAKIVAKHGMPRDSDGLRELPGIGEYTAAAIASIAHGEPVPVVDGNVERVASRYMAAHLSKRETREKMAAWISRRFPGDFNQAVMELGATVCTPKSPSCGVCPLARDCAGKDEPQRYPLPKNRPEIRAVKRRVKLATKNGKVFLRKGGLVDGMWDLPPSRGGGETVGEVRHSILDRSYRITIHEGRASGEGRWFSRAQLDAVPLGAAARKCLRAARFF